jgi:predicted RNA-binding Zn ribbon-like protein
MNAIAIAPIDAIGHAHVADLGTCLDFINSESYDDGVPHEHLGTADDAIAYFTLRGLAHEDALRAQAARDTDAWVARIHGLRAALREVWDAEVEHRIPGQGALDAVNAVLREAPRIELIAGEDCCGVGHRHTADDPTGEALARVAGPFAEAIAAGQTGRFRICANDGCRWVFADSSRAGRRRWCDMSSCGNVAKVRRYRARRKAADAPAGQSPAGA